MNQEAILRYGYSRAEFLGMTILDIQPTADIPLLLHEIRRSALKGPSTAVWRHRSKDGMVFNVKTTRRELTVCGRAAEFGEPGANEKVNVGIIGLGGRAQDIAKRASQCRKSASRRCATASGPNATISPRRPAKTTTCRTYEDFRQMIAKEKLDGVMVETTTHARAWIASRRCRPAWTRTSRSRCA